MRSNVTAILVARSLGEHLDATVSALTAQSVAPDRIIAIAQGSDELARHLAGLGFDAVIQVNSKLSFGAAVEAGVRGSDDVASHAPEWLWLIAEDSAPEPAALGHLLLSVKTTGTAAVAGPKLVDWDDPSRIIELSQGLTTTGARWVLDRQELDQQQYDHYEDVLGVGPVGMLVRRDVWKKLGGFDAALPVYDDGLDFSVRARLAGYRVVVAPQARLRFARTGIAGPEINHRASVLRRARRRARTAALHRRVTYAPAFLAPFIWLAMPIIGVLGMLWALIRERPGTMLGELVAALTVFFRPGRIVRARRTIRAQSTAGWGAVRPLRTDLKAVRSVRTVQRESILASQGLGRTELHFIHTGGLGLTVAATVVSVALTWWLVGASFVTGGATGQLSSSLATLWGNTISAAAVDVQSLGSFADTVPADPFTWVLALIGTITFFNPSFAVVLMFMLAIPVATLGGWMWAARLTDHMAGRLLGGVAWGVSPVIMTALVTGRLTTLVLVMTLPWVMYAASKAASSWSWAGITSFLAAIVLAAAPSLIPAALVVLVVGLVAHPRGVAKLLATVIVPLVLFAPKLLGVLAAGRITNLFIDPSVQIPYTPASLPELLLGFSTAGLGGMPEALQVIGFGDALPELMLAIGLSAPLAVLAIIGAFTGTSRRTILIAVSGLAGLVTAALSPHFALVAFGDELVSVWAGSGAALYWLSVISLAVIGTRVLFKAQLVAAIIAMVGVVALALPAAVTLVTADTAVHPDRQIIPAVMNAELNSNPNTQALVITPLGEDSVRARLLGGNALTLDRIRTAELVAPETTAEATLAELVATLSSAGAGSLTDAFHAADITFVLLEGHTAAGATQLRSRMQEVFDQNETLSAVGSTTHGLLWRVNTLAGAPTEVPASTDTAAAAELAEDDLDFATSTTRPVSGTMLWIAQLVLIGLMLLLALPTGEVRERPHKRRIRRDRAAKRAGNDTPSDATHTADPVEVPAHEALEAGGNADSDGGHADSETDDTGEIAVITTENELPDDDTIFVSNSAASGRNASGEAHEAGGRDGDPPHEAEAGSQKGDRDA